jgi:hypothetical protein
MKPMDVISSVDFGYRLVWAERGYLARLATVPVAIKLLTLALVIALDWPEDSLRSTIITLPSLFASGWMLSHLSRLVFYGQRWPFRPSGNAVADNIALQERAHGISAGTLFFALTFYLFFGLSGVAAALVPAEKMQQMAAGNQTLQEPSILAGFLALGFLLLSLWSVRFLFLFIPAAAGLSVRPVVRAPQGMLLSLQMMGIGLVSFIPVILLASWLFTVAFVGFSSGNTISPGMIVLGQAWMVPAVTIAQMIITASIAYGVRTLMSEKSKP